jgi:hypothetical protein
MMAPIQRAGLAALRRLATQAHADAQVAAERQKTKRARKRDRAAAHPADAGPAAIPAGVTRVPNFGSATSAPPAPARPPSAATVREWFRVGIRGLYPDLVLPPNEAWWTVVEMTLAKKLLAQYGPALVERAVAWGCAQWPAFLSRTARDAKPLLGYPNIRWLWGWREAIFLAIQDAEAAQRLIVGPQAGQRKASKRDRDEWTGTAPGGHGWGALDATKDGAP